MTLGTIEDSINDMKSGIYDFTDDGECTSCGACCSNFLPISSKEIKEIKRYVKKKHIKEQKIFAPTRQPVLDLTCPFRSENERKCLIYSVRPAICKDFKCDKPRKQIKMSKELYHRKYTVCDMRKEFFNNE